MDLVPIIIICSFIWSLIFIIIPYMLKKAEKKQKELQAEKWRQQNEETLKIKQLNDILISLHKENIVKKTLSTFQSQHNQTFDSIKKRYPFIQFEFYDKEFILDRIDLKDINDNINIEEIAASFIERISINNFLHSTPIWDKLLSEKTLVEDESFDDYYLPDNWKEIRNKCFERDHGQCQRCGISLQKYSFQVHHLLARSQGGTHSFDNLVTLCLDCHAIQGGDHNKIKLQKHDFFISSQLTIHKDTCIYAKKCKKIYSEYVKLIRLGYKACKICHPQYLDNKDIKNWVPQIQFFVKSILTK
jgi:hypothetical protein